MISQLFYADGTTPVSRAVDTVGSAIVAWERLGNGQEVGDVYTLAFSAVTSTQVTITVTCNFSRNSQHNRTVTVPRDESWQYGIVRGWRLKISASSSFDSTWSSKVHAGLPVPRVAAGNPLGIRYDYTAGPTPVITYGTPGRIPFLFRGFIKNVSGELWVNARWVLAPWATDKPITGEGLVYVCNESLGALVEKAEGSPGQKTLPYVVTFANFTAGTGGAPDRADVLFDGGTVQVLDTNDPTASAITSTQLKLDGTTKYRIQGASGTGLALNGFSFIAGAAAVGSDVAHVFVHEVRWVRIAADSGGDPVDWVDDQIVLTQTGAVEGEVASGASVPVHLYSAPPLGAPHEKNPHPQGPYTAANLAGATGL